MGLDTYASRSPGDRVLTAEDEQAFEDASIELCGGSSVATKGRFGARSTRRLSSMSLAFPIFQEWIPPAVVSEMASALQSCDPEETARSGNIVPEELAALARFFGCVQNVGSVLSAVVRHVGIACHSRASSTEALWPKLRARLRGSQPSAWSRHACARDECAPAERQRTSRTQRHRDLKRDSPGLAAAGHICR